MSDDPFDEATEFPSLRETGIPEDPEAIRAIVAGQRSLEHLYAGLSRRAEGDGRFLAGLLARDWKHRVGDLLTHGGQLLESWGTGAVVLPGEAQVDEIVERHHGGAAKELAGVAADFGSRALICHRLVPWKSETAEVFEHFRACLEAEDGHLAVLDFFQGLLVE